MPDVVDKATRSRMMSGIRGKDTQPELTVRRFLHRRGFRYRIHDRRLPGRPDIVLPKYRSAVFVHGCFWHQHPGCRFATTPDTNAAFWQHKLSGNQMRDAEQSAALTAAGWGVITVWECQINNLDWLPEAIQRPQPRIRDAMPVDILLLAPIEARGDAQFAAVGHPEFLGAATTSDEYAEQAIAEGRMRVAELDGRVVGWLLTSRLDGELFLSQVSVEPAHSRQGIGTALLFDCIERARAAREPSLLLDTQADVAWNAPWYARHGFEVVPVEAWAEGLRARARAQEAEGFDWATRVFMRLPLGPAGRR